MKNYNKKNESSYLTYLDANNLHGWAMALKLPVNGFMWYNEYLSDFNEDFIKNYNENSDIGYFLEVDVEYPKKLFSSHKDLPFLPESKKNRKSRKSCLWYRRQRKIGHSYNSFKTGINGLKFKKIHRVIKAFNHNKL